MPINLIFNIDDLGLTRGGVKAGLELLEQKCVTSTTVMANLIQDQELEKLSKIQDISVGIHFNVEVGKSLSNTSLNDSEGNFIYRAKPSKIGLISDNDLYKELEAQYKRVKKYIPDITHIDTHHHFHILLENVHRVVLKFAKDNNLKVRENASKFNFEESDKVKPKVFGTRGFIGDFFGNGIYDYPEKFKTFDQDVTYDVMCHPAYLDEELMNISSYNTYREKEIQIIKNLYLNNNINIINYKNM